MSDPPGPTQAPRARPPVALGMVFAAISSASFGMNITLARLAYDGGASQPAVIQIRYLVALIVIPTVMLLSGRRFRPPATLRARLIWVTLGNFGVTLGYLSAILFIPVSLAVVVFYTYPLMVLAVASIVQGTRPGVRQVAAFIMAFAGLVLTLGPSFEALDPRGIGLALCAAVSAAFVFIASPRVVGTFNALGAAFYTNIVGVSLMLVLATFLGGYALPESTDGWLGLGGVSVFYVSAICFMYLALHAAGPIRASLIFNLEPVVAIAAAALILGERLAPLQIAGVALVIGALSLARLARAKA